MMTDEIRRNSGRRAAVSRNNDRQRSQARRDHAGGEFLNADQQCIHLKHRIRVRLVELELAKRAV